MLGIGLIFVLSEFRKDRRARLLEEGARASERRQRDREQQHLRTRREARERARLAFPELLDEDEAKAVDQSHPGLKKLSGPDEDLICEAQELVRAEIEVIKSTRPYWSYEDERSSSVAKNLKSLDEEVTILGSAYEDTTPNVGVSLHLGTPARIIDCREAGLINLYTAAQVEDARRESGFTDYLAFLDRRALAPEVARQIVERARMAEQRKREAEEARLASITTKLEELPPLPEEDR
jgi:hypothetical protein